MTYDKSKNDLISETPKSTSEKFINRSTNQGSSKTVES